MLIVEYAKYGNLRDYLRRKRPPGHVLSGSFEQDENDDSYKQDDNDDLIHSLTTIDLILFCLQIASGMEYLHSKKVKKIFFFFVNKNFVCCSVFIVILLLEMFY
jgi:serine/threonine protein kinase